MHNSLAGFGLAMALHLAACGGSSRPAPSEPVAAEPSPCIAMASHIEEILLVGADGDRYVTEAATAIGRVVAERCQVDSWERSVIDCLATADERGVDTCFERLTPEQKKAVDVAVEKEMEPVVDKEMEPFDE